MARRVAPDELSQMLPHTEKIRNICILAHVDHGKTSLSDSLVCSNGVISSKLAGKLRYLDSTEEEQRRGITMHSSAISLIFDMEKPSAAGDSQPAKPDRHLINLVDSPGHMDFSSDVSTATRLCDGALIVIDVLEGICTQTHAVLYKALKERMRPCLILNKVDRLILDMKLTSVEGFYHLRRLLERANALAFTLVNSEIRSYEEALATAKEGSASISPLDAEALLEEWRLAPEKGNVVFASALDCWGFGLGKFSTLWANKLGLNKNTLHKYFFEDYSLNVKDKKIVKYDPQNSGNGQKPMFAQMILDPIWQLYEATAVNPDLEKVVAMAAKIGVELPPREVNARDPRSTLQAIFRRWLPLSDAILRMVVRCVPSPVEAQANRLPTLLDALSRTAGSVALTSPNLLARMVSIKNSIGSCNAKSHADIVVFISKMIPVKLSELSPRDAEVYRQRAAIKTQGSGDVPPEQSSGVVLREDDEVFLALGRVFSGQITRDNNLFVLSNRHDPLIAASSITGDETFDGDVPNIISSTATRLSPQSVGLYLCLGPSVVPVDSVSAGNIVAIAGLDQLILKTATVSSSWACQPLRAMTFQARPMVRVAVEPKSHLDLGRLERGLASLYQYDPAVEVGTDEMGQHTVSCLGELHLELCLKSLTDRFAKCEVVASEPLVPYRESLLPYEQGHRPVLPPPWSDLPGLDECDGGKCYLSAAGGSLGLDLSACPLPPALVALLESHNEAVWALSQMLSKQIWTHDRLLSWYSSQKRSADVDVEVGTDTSIDARMASEGVSFLDKFVSAIQCKAVSEENSSFVTFLTPSDFEASYSKLGESSNGIADIAPILLSFGSQSVLANILIMSRNATLNLYADAVPTSHRVSASEQNTSGGNSAKLGSFSLFTSSEDQKRLLDGIWTRAQNALVAGFQEATHAGPIMGEPVQGVIFSVDALSVHLTACLAACPGLTVAEVAAIFNVAPDSFVSPVSTLKEDGSDSRSSSLISSGQMISEVRNALRLCVLSCPVRIVEPVYACDLQCDQSQLGNLYAVLSKRRGEVTKEDIIDGTSLFILSATLPVSESFGFAQELLRKTSGNATAPQLVFSHWQTIEQDPFWRPSTEEEIEEYGDATGMERRNIFRVRIDKIRKRKGLAVEEKVVISAEKQRNMNKKK